MTHVPRPAFRCFLPLLPLILATAAPAASLAGGVEGPSRTGQELFRANCAACHAPDGKGQSRSRVGFSQPLPDLGDPDFSSREARVDWAGIVTRGGPSRGFSEIMPAFGQALTQEEIKLIVEYAKSLADSRAWPPGEFNLPRPLVTGKAFPEDEAVFSSTITDNGEGLSSIGGKFVYEKRFGTRNMWEFALPFSWNERTTAPSGSATEWGANIGDAVLAVKRAFYFNLDRGSIFSGSAELIMPTGDRASGAGKGTFILEPFLAFGQILPARFFLQAQAGMEIPFDKSKGANEAFLRVAIGKSFSFQKFGPPWTPMVEILAAKELVSGEKIIYDIVPQIQITLNKRFHVRVNFGVRLPLNEAEGRQPVFMAYLLWDWFDGAFFDGW
jgi:mono/diheme cytochrome c family protein